MTDTPAIEVQNLHVGYGATPVLHGIDLAVAPGEFVAILGSSGCGKTTLLRTIAGFQKSSAGAIRLSGRDVANLPPEKRNIAMVFQSYALWPHMTVLGNVGYGLRLRGVPRPEVRRRVGEVLKLLNLSGLEERKVTNLSGGQRQRVALGRALAIDPQLLLLDEPLSNLDAKVRVQLRQEIKTLQNRLGFTAIHVTHDREEAMTMADRIVVMDAGPHRPGRPAEGGLRPAELALRRELHGGGEHARSRGRPAPGGGRDRRRRCGAHPLERRGARRPRDRLFPRRRREARRRPTRASPAPSSCRDGLRTGPIRVDIIAMASRSETVTSP